MASILVSMGNEKKVTVHLPEDLLHDAQAASGKGITETIRQGLRLVAAKDAYDKLRTLRGAYRSKLKTSELRKDG